MQKSNMVIIVLLVVNLFATVWYGNQDVLNNQSSIATAHKGYQLPAILSSEVRNELSNNITEYFNNRDFEKLYNMMGPAARAQITRESSYETFGKLVEHFVAIEEVAFTHSDLVGEQGDTKNIILHYAIKLSAKSTFGQKGTLKINLAVRGNEYEIYGFRINAG